jgi:SOS-response transcriptional repressor LexA
VLEFVEGYTRFHGEAPSLDEIAADLGAKSKSNAHRYVSQLVCKGYVERMARFRGVVILPPPDVIDLRGVTDAALVEECRRRGLLTLAKP